MWIILGVLAGGALLYAAPLKLALQKKNLQKAISSLSLVY